MTLLHKLINKTDAELLFASCLRQSDGKSFRVHIERPNFSYSQLSIDEFNTAMNGQIESIIDRTPSQYQWTYKRFKRQPKGESLY